MIRNLTALALASLPFVANAGLLFSDNFDQEKIGTPSAGLSQWNITDKSVDVIGSGSLVGLPMIQYRGDRFLDMDGTSLGHSNGSIITKNAMSLLAGQKVTVSYDLNLSEFAPRNSDNGISMQLFSVDDSHKFKLLLNKNDKVTQPSHNWTHESYTFDAPSNLDHVYLRFSGTGKQDWAGMYLDNVNVTAQAVPEPASLAVLGVGLFGLARRRAKK